MPEVVLPGYTLVAPLGTGARSVIYKVVRDTSGEVFAVKRIDRSGPADDRFIEQAENEYSISSRVTHESLRRCFEIHRLRKVLRLKSLLLVMEFVDGTSLEQSRPEALSEIVRIFCEAAKGLAALHEMGYVHADIKPNNILVCADGRVKLIDFGQSCPVGHVKSRIQGTPDYIAPEQAHRRPIDQRTDVFNLGAAMYWVVTGRAIPTVLPSQPRKAAMDILGPGDALPPHEYNPAVPAAWSKLIMDCCKHNPHDRPADMREVLARLGVARHKLEREGSADATPPTTGSGGPGARPAPPPESNA